MRHSDHPYKVSFVNPLSLKGQFRGKPEILLSFLLLRRWVLELKLAEISIDFSRSREKQRLHFSLLAVDELHHTT